MAPLPSRIQDVNFTMCFAIFKELPQYIKEVLAGQGFQNRTKTVREKSFKQKK
jgi:hypothetical protein